MSRRPTSDARRAGWMILGLLAVPVLSVTSAAMVADVASTTDPAAALIAIPATLGGVVMGGLVFRLGRVVRSGAIAIRTVLRALVVGAAATLSEVQCPVAADSTVRPAFIPLPASVGRRGPPVSLR